MADLLEELTTTNKAAFENDKALVTEIKALKEVLVKQGAGDAGGDEKSTGGQPWNVLVQEGPGFSDLGGDVVDITFPVGRELIATPVFKGYHCHFTYVKSGKEDKTNFRVSAKVSAAGIEQQLPPPP